MKKLIIDKYFIDEYLTSGRTKDNFIFENCPTEFLAEASLRLSDDCNDVKSCCVYFLKEELDNIRLILDELDGDYAKKLIGRDYVCCKIMQSLLKKNNDSELDKISFILAVYSTRDIDAIKKCHSECPMPFDISNKAKDMKNIELNIFLNEKADIFTQQAINNFISSRESYSIKLFLKNQLSTSYDQMGNLMQCPHDFMIRDVEKYIEFMDCDVQTPID